MGLNKVEREGARVEEPLLKGWLGLEVGSRDKSGKNILVSNEQCQM